MNLLDIIPRGDCQAEKDLDLGYIKLRTLLVNHGLKY